MLSLETPLNFYAICEIIFLMKRGFSIIEAAVVIAVIGILLVLGIPQYNRYNASIELKNTAQLLHGIIDYAKTEAKTYNNQAVIWNSNTQNMALNNTRLIEAALRQPDGQYKFLKSIAIPQNINCSVYTTGSSPYVTISPNETIDAACFIIYLYDQRINSYFALKIPQIGNVTLSKKEGQPPPSDSCSQ